MRALVALERDRSSRLLHLLPHIAISARRGERVNLCSQRAASSKRFAAPARAHAEQSSFRKHRRPLQFGHIAQVVSRPKGDRYYQGKDRRQEHGHHRRVSLEKELQHDEFQQLFIERLGDSPPRSRSVTARGEVRKKSAIPRQATMNAPKVKKVRITSRAILFRINPSLWRFVNILASNCRMSSVCRETLPVTVKT